MLILTASNEVKAPNAGSLSTMRSGTTFGNCPDAPCFQYSSLKGYSGWSRHLWISEMEQVSCLVEEGYHIAYITVISVLSLWYHRISLCCAWQTPSLQYIDGLHGRFFCLFRSCLLWMICPAGKQTCAFKEKTVKDHFSGLQTLRTDGKNQQIFGYHLFLLVNSVDLTRVSRSVLAPLCALWKQKTSLIRCLERSSEIRAIFEGEVETLDCTTLAYALRAGMNRSGSGMMHFSKWLPYLD